MFGDFLDIVREGLLLDGKGSIFLYILLALGFSILCWWGCSNYTKLWNKAFRVKAVHHAICGIAALLTFFCTLCFIGLKNLKPISEQAVHAWSRVVVEDVEWNNETFRKAYYAVKESGLEDMSFYPSPEKGGRRLPISGEKTRLLTASIYADEACRNFDETNPFLGYFLWTSPGIPKQLIEDDLKSFFSSFPGKTYPLTQAVRLAVRQINGDLLRQTGRIVYWSRMMLLLLFLCVQLIPFTWIGILAYKDLEIGKYNITYKH